MDGHDLPSDTPRVLFVNHSSRTGGAEFILLANLRAFGANSSVWLFEDGPLKTALADHPPRVLMPSRPSGFTDIKRDQGMARAALPMLGGMLRMVREIAAAARRHDMVYANSQKAFVLSALAAKLAGRPLVWHLHDILTPAHFGGGQLRLLRTLAPLATRVIVPSQAAADAFTTLCGRADRVRVVPNGVTLPPDPMAGAGMAERRAALGLPGEGFLVGVFSRLSPWKGQAVVLRAVTKVPGAVGIITGDALFGEDDYAASLRRLAEELGIADRVRFLGHRHDVPALMRAMDVVVHPSTDPEPFGRTLVEAMLCRTPLVAASAGAIPEIAGDNEAGLLVPPGDDSALAAALREIRQDPAATQARIEAGERRALALFSEDRMREGVLSVVREVRQRQGS